MDTGYKGDLTPQAAWELLKNNQTAILVDVRTLAEFRFVGMVRLEELGKKAIYIPWVNEVGEQNGEFASTLKAHISDFNTPILFLCRSGGRSQHAAIRTTYLGFMNCYNILEGFEGDLDQDSHRGTAAGWKYAGLPWKQS